MDALLDNSQVDHKIVRQAVDRLKDQSNDDRDFETNFNLGLAYLNLKHWREGIKYLQAAVRILPDNKNLVEQVNELAKKIALKKAKISGEGSSKGSRPGVILAVDDSPTIRKLVSITLEKQGYQVLLAEDGLEALAIISEKTPDLILLDITMPRMDGYQLCQTIKENQKTEHIPVVMLSGNDGFFDKVRGRVAGSTEYITKPFDSDLLVQTVKKYTLSPGTGEKEVVRQSNAA
ncbi:MAG: response regulator [Chloroflexota bacterium]